MSSTTHPRRRSLLALAAAVTALTLIAGPSMAVFPHFKSAKTTLVYSTERVAAATTSTRLPDLLFSFTLVGLGNVETTVRADVGSATAVFGCVNNGANRPKATNKTATTMPLSASGTFTPDRNGRVLGEILVDTSPLADTTLTCPSGQTLTAISLQLDDLSLTEITTGATTTVPSVFVKLFG